MLCNLSFWGGFSFEAIDKVRDKHDTRSEWSARRGHSAALPREVVWAPATWGAALRAAIKPADQGAQVSLCPACEVGNLLSSLVSREPLTSLWGSGLLSPSGLGSLLSAYKATGSFFSALVRRVDAPDWNVQVRGLTYPCNWVIVDVSMRSATSLVVITILLQSSSKLLRLIERTKYITYLFQGNVRAAEKQSSWTYSLIL